jgi:hypothetical protein
MALQLTRAGVRPPTAGEAAVLRAEYAERSCIRLPGFLEPALLRRVQQRVDGAGWQEHVHDDLDPPAIELIIQEPVLDGILAAVMQHLPLFEAVRAITGCDPIGSFAGRVYRMDPGGGHHDSWHGDDDEGAGPNNRMAALSLNLSPGTFEGGVLELRRRGSDRLLHRVANTGAGDAILFRIDDALEHRVTDVKGTVPKIAWAGWFQREPRLW